MAELRRCIGSARFGIEAHDAPIENFPKQPSQPDGLGRMCSEHWRTYTRGLARDAAAARKAASEATEPVAETAEGEPTTAEAEVPVEEPAPKRRRAKSAAVADVDEAGAG